MGAEDDWAAAMSEQGAAAGEAGAAEGTAKADDLFKEFDGAEGGGEGVPQNLQYLQDVPVTMTVELGRTRMPIKHLLQLSRGSVVGLNTGTNEPLNIYINGHLIAIADVVLTNNRYGIRLVDIITPAERIRRLK